ncbi:pectate lyase [Streptosporangium sp. NPDC023615]|uniref:pectate lyase family protein n=1 Tax=Streptosporangium sp. NPDC023615 TaxID=3154794 RepID=UPI0034358452
MKRAVALTALLSLAVLAAPAASASVTGPATDPVTGPAAPAAGPLGSRTDLGRQTLPAGDGWASEGTGTTGGAAAPASNVHVVSTRTELAAALAAPSPSIVHVKGTIAPESTCADYATGGYTLEGYLAAYDPAVWGRDTVPSGPMEAARVASAARQTADVKLKVRSGTTLVGLGKNARIRGVNLHVDKADSVIIRNITFEDTADCFPKWDPTDGAEGNWNSLYDNITVTGSTHVWVDHNTFTDGDNPDSGQLRYFGRPYQVHDGQLDITNASNFVTASWNRFSGHDKTMLIGSTNNPANDTGKLNVTIHHNHFENVLQRLPRVRFGQVHVYNNYYEIPDAETFDYALGVGVGSQIFSENNFFRPGRAVDPAALVRNWGGTALTSRGDVLRVGGRVVPIDLVAVHNAVNDPDLGADAGWTPVLHTGIDPAGSVRREVSRHAGAGEVR